MNVRDYMTELVSTYKFIKLSLMMDLDNSDHELIEINVLMNVVKY